MWRTSLPWTDVYLTPSHLGRMIRVCSNRLGVLGTNLALTGLPRQRVCGPRGLVGGFRGRVIRCRVCGSSGGGGISFILRPTAGRARWPDPSGRLMGAWFSRSSTGKSFREIWRPDSRGSSGAMFSRVSLIGEQVSSSSQIGDWSNSSRVQASSRAPSWGFPGGRKVRRARRTTPQNPQRSAPLVAVVIGRQLLRSAAGSRRSRKCRWWAVARLLEGLAVLILRFLPGVSTWASACSVVPVVWCR